ncbi:MAG: hypothetical protein LKJ21_08775, partial [Oscillospiraceae bacterium]|nr:hypothetical protein [Oscillospiraceae bacterium]
LDCAKAAHNLLPPLPPGMKPVYLHILNALYRTRDGSGRARVSDLNKALGFLLPNTTRYLGELSQLNVIEKTPSNSDKRVVMVKATELGEKYIRKFVVNVHKHLEKELASISEADCTVTAETIRKIYLAMKKVCREERNIALDE